MYIYSQCKHMHNRWKSLSKMVSNVIIINTILNKQKKKTNKQTNKQKNKKKQTPQIKQRQIVFTEPFKCFFFSLWDNIWYSYSILHSSMISHGTYCQLGTVSSDDDLTC